MQVTLLSALPDQAAYLFSPDSLPAGFTFPLSLDSALLTLPWGGAQLTCWKEQLWSVFHFLSKENKEFVQHGQDPGAGEQWYPTVDDCETEPPAFLTTVTNSKGPTSLLKTMTGVSYHLGADENLSWRWKMPSLGAIPQNFPIQNRASFRKERFSFYHLPEYYL